MLEKKVNWNDLPVRYKRGSYVRRVVKFTPFPTEELNRLTPKHQAHSNPDLVIERSVIESVELPIFSTIANKVNVVFGNMTPISS